VSKALRSSEKLAGLQWLRFIVELAPLWSVWSAQPKLDELKVVCDLVDAGSHRPGELTRRGFLTQVGIVSLSSTMGQIGAAATLGGLALNRSRVNFDSGWRFLKGDHVQGQTRGLDDLDWRLIDLPHDWSIEGPFDGSENSQGNLPTGVGWYRKRFKVADRAVDGLVSIEFDGVYENSEVWINEHYLGRRPSGYVPFHYDLTPFLNRAGENLIAVRVDNSRQPNSRWYSGSGIYRHTWILTTSHIHVAPWGVFVTTPIVAKDRATVEVKTRVQNRGNTAAVCSVTTAVSDAHGAGIQSAETSQTIEAGGESEFVQRFQIASPNLWSHDNPATYLARTTIRQAGAVVDNVDTPFGIRDAVFDSRRGFLINGTSVKLNGVCLHHDGGCVGAAVPEQVWERRLEALREMGCNAIRTSHNPPAAEFLDLCDRMGFYVMAEAFDEWRHGKGQIGPYGYAQYFDEWFERDVENFVRRDRNHPSIVIWSAGNEIGDQSAPEGAETLQKLLAVFRREDPTRLVTCGCDQIASEPSENRVRPEFLEAMDVVGYNYVDRWRTRIETYFDADRGAHPQWRVVGTESGSMGGKRGDYGHLAHEGPGSFERGSRGRMIDVEQLWKFVKVHDYVAGDFMWTGIDYLGEARWPSKAASSGVLDTCGFKKDGFYFYQSQWTAEPMIHLFPHWNWAGREGEFLPVLCYTNCDTVELFLNGKSVGVKGYAFPREGMENHYGNYPERAKALRTTADLHLAWDVPYEPGRLVAVGTRAGKQLLTVELRTAGPPSAIMLIPDRHSVAAGTAEIVHIAVQVVDDRGTIVPDASNEIRFEVKGDGALIGLDNGDPESHEDYRSNVRRAFHGLALAIVRSHGNKGAIEVTATGSSVRTGTVSIVSV
jgi:beta-galactosidase